MFAGGRKRKTFDEDDSGSAHSLEHGHSDAEQYKRSRTSDSGRTESLHSYDIGRYLAVLDRDQLLGMLQALVGNPDVRPLVTAMVPRPTVQSVASHLQSLERKLSAAFPYSKWGVVRDDYSFNRVRPVLLELRNSLCDFLSYFAEQSADVSPLEHFHSLFSFLRLATSTTLRLPDWQVAAHNDTKRELLARIKESWRTGIEHVREWTADGQVVARTVVEEWAQLLAASNSEANGCFGELVHQFTDQLGWLLGIAPPPSASATLSLFDQHAFSGVSFSFSSMAPVFAPPATSPLKSCGVSAFASPGRTTLAPQPPPLQFGSSPSV
ncbi:Tethering factor for nuclear proteasome sts1 [Sorochytrium milnesiophthora]